MLRSAPIDYIQRTREQYSALNYPPYEWAQNSQTPPWHPLHKPLSASRVALVCSGGIYARGQIAFHHKDDNSLRLIPTDVATTQLRTSHFAYDQSAARKDINCVFPIEPLRRAEAAGKIGTIAPYAFTFMGGIYSQRKVVEQLAPAIVSHLIQDEVDVAIMVPV
jgi:D-proline reductase (dithiol) PrdB